MRDKRANANADQWMNLEERWWSKIAHKDQEMAMPAGRSPSGAENAYAVAVVSKNNKAKKTKTLVQIPALCVVESTPNASNAVKNTKTVVHPCHNEKGRWMNNSSAIDSAE